MADKNYSSGINDSQRSIINKAVGYALFIAGFGVLIITLVRGVVGYKEGLLSFTEAEFLNTFADVESDFLPVIEPQLNENAPQLDIPIDEVDKPSDDVDSLNTIQPEETEVKESHIPIKISIANIDLEQSIEFAEKTEMIIDSVGYSTWIAPEQVVGWQFTSAELGEKGNTVLIGHHNSKGSVFKNLKDLEDGDIISIFSEDKEFKYRIVEILILLEKEQDLEVRLENARWLWPTIDERVTLVTCWPKYDNSHRLIVVALPID